MSPRTPRTAAPVADAARARAAASRAWLCEAPLSMCNGVCVDTRVSASSCGACQVVCDRDAPRCAGGLCTCPGGPAARCRLGCVDLLGDRRSTAASVSASARGLRSASRGVCSPRPVSPTAGARVGTRTPMFRWSEGDGAVEVCADPACARVVESMEATAGRGARVTRRLAPGVYFWHVRRDGAVATRASPFQIDARDAHVPALLPAPPDLDGDGLEDVLVGFDLEGVAVFLGGVRGLGPTPDRELRIESVPEVRVTLRAAGDLRGDPFGDALLSDGRTERTGRRCVDRSDASGGARRPRPARPDRRHERRRARRLDQPLPEGVSVFYSAVTWSVGEQALATGARVRGREHRVGRRRRRRWLRRPRDRRARAVPGVRIPLRELRGPRPLRGAPFGGERGLRSRGHQRRRRERRWLRGHARGAGDTRLRGVPRGADDRSRAAGRGRGHRGR